LVAEPLEELLEAPEALGNGRRSAAVLLEVDQEGLDMLTMDGRDVGRHAGRL